MKLHLIGICGTGMGSLAGLLKAAGHDVRGSDEHVYPPMSRQLAEQAIPVFSGFRPENLDWGPDKVVVGNVCRRDHIEVVAAQERGLPLTSFPAALEELFLTERHSLVVAGTHGKTTTSSLLAFVLLDAGRDPSFLIGGVPINFGTGFRLGGGSDFVIEGDEYDTAFFDKKSKFLHYKPKAAILTSVELDHVDIFASFDAVKQAFLEFVALLPQDGYLVAAASSAGAVEVARTAPCRVETYSAVQAADWNGKVLEVRPGGRTVFEVTHRGKWFATMETGLPGEHNLENILAVTAIAQSRGLGPDEIARGVRRFAGVRRRQEIRGVAQGVTVIDDFAHHPTAVRQTLAALRKRFGTGKLVAVYEPRSATSRRAVFQRDFAEAFSAADEVVIGPLYQPEKLAPAERFDPERLAGDLRAHDVRARAIQGGTDEIVSYLNERVSPGDTVVVMSSGSFDGLHDRLLGVLGDAVMPALPTDEAAIEELLRKVDLPTTGLAEHLQDFLVLRDAGGAVIGCVGVEIYDEAGVLRSLAVSPERRGQGLGWMLADQAVRHARARGERRLYLLTETASDFFAQHFGFRRIGPEAVEPPVSHSSQFHSGSRAGATSMRLDL